MLFNLNYRDRLRQFAQLIELKRSQLPHGARSAEALSKRLAKLGHSVTKNEIASAINFECRYPRVETLDALARLLRVPLPDWWPISTNQPAVCKSRGNRQPARKCDERHLCLADPRARDEFSRRLRTQEQAGGQLIYLQTDWCLGLCQSEQFLLHRLTTSLEHADQFDSLLQGYFELASERVTVARTYERVVYLLPTESVIDLENFFNQHGWQALRQQLNRLEQVQGRVAFIPPLEAKQWLSDLRQSGVINYLYLPAVKRGTGFRLKRHGDQTITVEELTDQREACFEGLLRRFPAWERRSESLKCVVARLLLENCQSPPLRAHLNEFEGQMLARS